MSAVGKEKVQRIHRVLRARLEQGIHDQRYRRAQHALGQHQRFSQFCPARLGPLQRGEAEREAPVGLMMPLLEEVGALERCLDQGVERRPGEVGERVLLHR